MKKPTIIVLSIIIILVALAAGWYLVSPLFLNKTVNEDFPSADMTEEERQEIAEAAADLNIVLPSLEEMHKMTQEELDELEMEIINKSSQLPDKTMDEELAMPEDNQPKLLFSGNFRDGDNSHKGSGQVSVYELPNKERIIRFENFQVTNGPDLRVLLVTNPDPNNSGDVQAGYIELGKLKGNLGNQNYEIPADIQLEDYKSVVIYCKPFHVVFSVAALN